MEIIFKIKDKSGRVVHLSAERWNHITTRHSDMAVRLEDIKFALTNPILIIPHRFDDTKRNYYLYYKNKKRYLLVSVKYLNGEGYVATAFVVRRIIRR